MVGQRRPEAAAGGGGILILGDRQAQGACWDIMYSTVGPTADVPHSGRQSFGCPIGFSQIHDLSCQD
jgi:hypothetical protein